MLCVIGAYWQPLPWLSAQSLAIIAVGTLALALHALGLQFANARQAPLMYTSISLTRGIAGLFVAVLLINQGLAGEGAALAFALGAAVSVIFFGWQMRRFACGGDAGLRRNMVTYGLPLGLTYLATMILDLSGRFIIGIRLGEEPVGPYAAGYDLVQQTVGAATNAIFLAAFPAVVRTWEESGAASARLALSRVLGFLLFLSPLLLMPFLALPQEISNVMFGPSMRDAAAVVMPWIALAILAGSFKSYYFDLAFQLTKRTSVQLYITFFMASLNVGVTLLLLPEFGIQGAAMAAAISFLVGAGLSWWCGREHALYDLKASQILAAGLVLTAVVFIARLVARNVDDDLQAVLAAGVVTTAVFVPLALVVNLGGIREQAFAYLNRRVS